MIYTKIQFAKDLKNQTKNKVEITEIGKWAHSVYLELPGTEDENFLKLLLHIGTMELGPEFAFTYEELEQISNDLIAGKQVTL